MAVARTAQQHTLTSKVLAYGLMGQQTGLLPALSVKSVPVRSVSPILLHSFEKKLEIEGKKKNDKKMIKTKKKKLTTRHTIY